MKNRTGKVGGYYETYVYFTQSIIAWDFASYPNYLDLIDTALQKLYSTQSKFANLEVLPNPTKDVITSYELTISHRYYEDDYPVDHGDFAIHLEFNNTRLKNFILDQLSFLNDDLVDHSEIITTPHTTNFTIPIFPTEQFYVTYSFSVPTLSIFNKVVQRDPDSVTIKNFYYSDLTAYVGPISKQNKNMPNIVNSKSLINLGHVLDSVEARLFYTVKTEVSTQVQLETGVSITSSSESSTTIARTFYPVKIRNADEEITTQTSYFYSSAVIPNLQSISSTVSS